MSLVGTLISAVISFYGFFKAVSLGVQAAQSAQATGVETQVDDATAAKVGMVMLLGGLGAFVSAVVAAIAIIKDKGVKDKHGNSCFGYFWIRNTWAYFYYDIRSFGWIK